jgi:hypothetical protein
MACPTQFITKTITATETINGTTVTITDKPESTLTVAVYSTVEEEPVSTIYTGKASTIYTGSISTITDTPTTIGAPVSTVTETSISTLTVGVYTTVTEEPGYTVTDTPTVIGAPVTTITDLETVLTGPITTVTVGVYTTVTEGPVSTIYTGEISTITTGAVTTITASPPTVIAGPATTVTVTPVPELSYPVSVCTTVTEQPTATVYTGNVTTVYTSITNDAPVATFTEYVPLFNFNIQPGGGLGQNFGNGVGGNAAIDDPLIGSNDTSKNVSGEISIDNLKNIFGSDFVKEHGDVLGKLLSGSIGHVPNDGYGYGSGVYQNEGSIINGEINGNHTNSSGVHNNGSGGETIPNNNRDIVIQNVFNNYYGGNIGREFADGDTPEHYVNFKGERAWSSPFGKCYYFFTSFFFYASSIHHNIFNRTLL